MHGNDDIFLTFALNITQCIKYNTLATIFFFGSFCKKRRKKFRRLICRDIELIARSYIVGSKVTELVCAMRCSSCEVHLVFYDAETRRWQYYIEKDQLLFKTEINDCQLSNGFEINFYEPRIYCINALK